MNKRSAIFIIIVWLVALSSCESPKNIEIDSYDANKENSELSQSVEDYTDNITIKETITLEEIIVTKEELVSTEIMTDIPDGYNQYNFWPPKILYRNNVYAYDDIISNCGEEWINKNTKFIYLGVAKYISSKDFKSTDETFATTYYGKDIKVYQCNEDCSVLAALTDDNNVVLFVEGNSYYDIEQRNEKIKSIWLLY